MNTQVEKCKKMGGLRREFARLHLEQKHRTIHHKNGAYSINQDIIVQLSKLSRNRFRFKSVKPRIDTED